MNTAMMALISIPARPTPVPPGETSPSFMLTSGTMPPRGVKLSWPESTEPVEVPVVEAAKTPEVNGPSRTSLLSMLPPDWFAAIDWSTPRRVSSGLPFCSNMPARSAAVIHRMPITARTTRPCPLLPTITP